MELLFKMCSVIYFKSQRTAHIKSGWVRRGVQMAEQAMKHGSQLPLGLIVWHNENRLEINGQTKPDHTQQPHNQRTAEVPITLSDSSLCLHAILQAPWVAVNPHFRPGEGSPNATNVVVGNPQALLLHNRSSPNFAYT